jgi:hypothetical protein
MKEESLFDKYLNWFMDQEEVLMSCLIGGGVYL